MSHFAMQRFFFFIQKEKLSQLLNRFGRNIYLVNYGAKIHLPSELKLLFELARQRLGKKKMTGKTKMKKKKCS